MLKLWKIVFKNKKKVQSIIKNNLNISEQSIILEKSKYLYLYYSGIKNKNRKLFLSTFKNLQTLGNFNVWFIDAIFKVVSRVLSNFLLFNNF